MDQSKALFVWRCCLDRSINWLHCVSRKRVTPPAAGEFVWRSWVEQGLIYHEVCSVFPYCKVKFVFILKWLTQWLIWEYSETTNFLRINLRRLRSAGARKVTGKTLFQFMKVFYIQRYFTSSILLKLGAVFQLWNISCGPFIIKSCFLWEGHHIAFICYAGR